MTPPNSIARLQAAWQAASRHSVSPALQDRLAQTTSVTLPKTSRVALSHLAERKCARISELATLAGVDTSTMSRALRPLDEAAFIRRQPGEDLRAVLVSITEDGERAAARVRAAGQDLLAEVLSDWREEDRAALAELMTRFAGALEHYLRDARDVAVAGGERA